MKTYKIFLASSNELIQDREKFIIFIAAYNKELRKYNIELQVEYWEDMDDKFNTSCKQEDYNIFLRECTFFVMLFWSKVGKYTLQEFKLAQTLLQDGKDIYLYCYERTTFKDGVTESDFRSKQDFIAYINTERKEQFQTQYIDISQVTEKFRRNFQAMLDDENNKSITPRSNILLEEGQAAIPHNFMGRTQDLINIKKKLDEGGRLIVLKGEGGLGKSTLASAFMTEHGNLYQNKAWIFCQKGIVDDLKSFVNDPEYFNDCINDTEKTITKLKQFLYSLPASTLLVLDNLNEKSDLDTFKQHFGQLEWHVLATSRIGTSIREEYPVMHLPPDIAYKLFTSVYDEKNEAFNYKLYQLLKAIGYNTLMIEVFSKHLLEVNTSFGDQLEDFLQKIEKEGLTLTKDAFKIETHYTSNIHKTYDSNRASVDQILEILYDFTDFQKAGFEHLRLYLVNLALLPAQSYDLKFLESLFGDRASGIIAGEQYFKPLADKGWLSYENNSYRMSPVVQDLVLAKNKEKIEEDSLILLKKLNQILKSDAYNLLNISLENAKAYVQPIFYINKFLANYPTEKLANYNFDAGIYFGNIGDLKSQKRTIEQYHEIYKQLFSLYPENLNYKSGLAISYSKLGGIYEQTGDWKNALLKFEEKHEIFKEICESSPEDLSYKNNLAISYLKLGGIYEQTGDWKNALLNYEEPLRIFKEINESSPENLSYKNGFAISYQNLGNIYNAVGDWKNALLNYEEQLRIFKEINQSSPENLSYKNNLAISYLKLGGIYEQTGDWKNALLNYEEENRIFKEIYESSPENLSYKNGLAISYQNLGDIYNTVGDWKNALPNYEEQLRIFKEIYESSPENLSYKNGLAISYAKLGLIYEQTGDWKNALLNYVEQLKIFKDIYESSPENLSYKNGLAISYQNLGNIYDTGGDWKNALLNYEEQLRMFKEIYESSPENLSYKYGLAISYAKLGWIYNQTGDWKYALLNYEEEHRIFKEIYESCPENIIYQEGLGSASLRLGDLYRDNGDKEKALAYFNEYYDINKKLVEKNPENLRFQDNLGSASLRLGDFYRDNGDKERALAYYKENYDINKKLVEKKPEDLRYQDKLGVALVKLGMVQDENKFALDYLKKAQVIFEAILKRDPENVSYQSRCEAIQTFIGGDK